jgi:hypothetical protein
MDLEEEEGEEKSQFVMKNGIFWDVTPCGCCKN